MWGLLSLANPAFPGYLLQTSPKERIVKPLVLRSIVAGIITIIGTTFMSDPQFRDGFEGYERIVLENVSSVLTALNVTHYRDGVIFFFPGITIEITKGSSHLYSIVYLSIIAAFTSMFFRTKNLLAYLSFTALFALLGHALSVAIFVSTFLSIQHPNDLTRDVFSVYRSIYLISGVVLIYVSFYLIAWRYSRRTNQNQSVIE